jgi:hypothetical protein
MSTETLKWILEAHDVISPGAKTAASSLIAFQVQLKNTQSEINRTAKAAKDAEGALMRFAKGGARGLGIPLPGGKDTAGFIGSLVGKGLGGAASLGLGLVEDAAGLIERATIGFGKLVLESASFREDTMVSFTNILGSAEEARGLFDDSLRIAKLTKFETRDVVNLYNDLLAGGFQKNELNTLVAAISDLGTARGMDRARELEQALIRVQSQGKLTAHALNEIAIAGVGAPGVVSELGKALGYKDKDFKSLSAKVHKAMSGGLIDATTGIGAVIDQIKNQFDKKNILGHFAVEQSETLSGVYSNFKDMLQNLFMGQETQDMPWVGSLKGTMKLLTGMMDPTTAKGRELQGVVNKIADDLLGIFDLDPKNADQTFSKILHAAEELEVGVHRLSDWMKNDLFPAMGQAFNKEGGLLKSIDEVILAVASEAGKAMGRALIEALKEGFSGGASGIMDTMKSIAPVMSMHPLAWFGSRYGLGGSAWRETSTPQMLPDGSSILPASSSKGSVNNQVHAPISIQVFEAASAKDTARQVGDGVDAAISRALGRLARSPSPAVR